MRTVYAHLDGCKDYDSLFHNDKVNKIFLM